MPAASTVDLGHLGADPQIEGSGLLFGDLARLDCHRLLERSGWVVRRSRPVQCMYRPGRSLVIRRTVWAHTHDEERRFTVVREAHARPMEPLPCHPEDQSVRVPHAVEAGHGRSWVFPFDPYLPDLAVLLSIEGARHVAQQIVGFRCSVRSSVVRYRPGKRAVVRFEVRPRGDASASPLVFFLKVQSTAKTERMFDASPMLRTADPRFVVPESRPRPGTLVHRAVEGIEMRSALIGRATSPSAVRSTEMIEVAGRIARLGGRDLPMVSTPRRRLRRATAVLSATVPEAQPRLTEVWRRIETILGGEETPDRRPVHGDLYEGQMLIDRTGSVVAVLDFDGFGSGELEMDVANVLAHLRALGDSHPHARARLEEHRRLLTDFVRDEHGCDPESVAAREAIAVLQLATGPLRVMRSDWVQRSQARIELAHRALAGAPI